ncbi:MAG: hypothetical protein NUV80_05225 [Candidatus Berkelbacteria bacterium]|nr:hypothetical protein [Candidatus Berkelbacteria bacterium]MCR4307939.1 hypothetical protein [Candidatus Berkelbacteria bacterium]
MKRFSEYFHTIRYDPASKLRFWWLFITVGLVVVFLLARVVEPNEWTVFKQLVILYAVDSLLFFFTDRISAKMGVLSLIFLVTMEVIVTIFYLISLATGPQI